MTLSGRFLSADQSIVLTDPNGNGSYVIPAAAVSSWDWHVTLGYSLEDVTSVIGTTTTRRYGGIRDVSGTINFSAVECKYYPGTIDPNEPIIKEYSVSDMLRMVNEKLESRNVG